MVSVPVLLFKRLRIKRGLTATMESMVQGIGPLKFDVSDVV